MKRFLGKVWTYILAFTVNLKKTAQAANRAKSADELDRFLRNARR